MERNNQLNQSALSLSISLSPCLLAPIFNDRTILRYTKVTSPFPMPSELYSNASHLLIFYWYQAYDYFLCIISFEIPKNPIRQHRENMNSDVHESSICVPITLHDSHQQHKSSTMKNQRGGRMYSLPVCPSPDRPGPKYVLTMGAQCGYMRFQLVLKKLPQHFPI